jgi:hypothetical protein
MRVVISTAPLRFAPNQPHQPHPNAEDRLWLFILGIAAWWDEFPCLALPGDPHEGALHDAALRTMAGILALPSLACQESALHGLGHWQRGHPQQVTRILDAFLQGVPALDPRLAAYARSARCGCCSDVPQPQERRPRGSRSPWLSRRRPVRTDLFVTTSARSARLSPTSRS